MRVRVEAMTRIKLLVLSGVLFLLPICLKAGVSVRRPSFEADTVYTDRPDTLKLDMPYRSGISISDNPGYAGKNTFQFIRTITSTLPMPLMPMMTIHANCYKSFFDGCINLKAVPESLLPDGGDWN